MSCAAPLRFPRRLGRASAPSSREVANGSGCCGWCRPAARSAVLMSPSNSSPLQTVLWSQLGAVASVGDGPADRVAVDALTGDQDPSGMRIDLDLGDAAQLANLAGDHLGGVPVG